MPINNETLIAIPPEIADLDELKQWLTRLIVALDILIGYRQSSEPEAQLISLGQLQTILDGLQRDINPIETYEQTIDLTYSQSQIQALSDAVTRVTNKVNEIVGE